MLRKSAVLRVPQACSDRKAPPEPSALSGSIPLRPLIDTKEKTTAGVVFSFVWWTLGESNPYTPSKETGK